MLPVSNIVKHYVQNCIVYISSITLLSVFLWTNKLEYFKNIDFLILLEMQTFLILLFISLATTCFHPKLAKNQHFIFRYLFCLCKNFCFIFSTYFVVLSNWSLKSPFFLPGYFKITNIKSWKNKINYVFWIIALHFQNISQSLVFASSGWLTAL